MPWLNGLKPPSNKNKVLSFLDGFKIPILKILKAISYSQIFVESSQKPHKDESI